MTEAKQKRLPAISQARREALFDNRRNEIRRVCVTNAIFSDAVVFITTVLIFAAAPALRIPELRIPALVLILVIVFGFRCAVRREGALQDAAYRYYILRDEGALNGDLGTFTQRACNIANRASEILFFVLIVAAIVCILIRG